MHFPIDQLDIIGCREIPAEPFLPRLLTPVFAVRGSSTVLLPPYHFIPGIGVFEPEVTTREEFDDLCLRERLLSVPVREARADNLLYLDTGGCVCYAHRDRVTATMRDYAQEHWSSAQAAFTLGSYTDAVVHARIALSANPVNVEPLFLQAAALRRLGQDSDARVCRTFALTRVSLDTYESGVQHWLSQSLSEKQSKMSLAATLKPREFHLAA